MKIYDEMYKFYYSKPLLPSLQEMGQKYTYREAKRFLSEQEVNQLHKPNTKKTHYYPIMGTPGTYQADLTFYDQYARKNHGYKMILTVIEVNSRRGYAIPLKNKSIDTVIQAFGDVIEECDDYLPMVSVTTDSGSEFKKKFTDFLHKEGIKHYTTDPADKHALGLCERFNRTIRGFIERFMSAFNTSS
jgi:IS30 family transposase